MINFSPLKFQPLFKYRIWGGDKLKTQLQKNYEGSNIGESWEISDVPNDETQVLEGDFKGYTLKQLIAEFKGAFLGESVYQKFGDAFPLLIKFIDAKTPLSIQVHPNNKMAKERHNSFGKNEMWYVMQADKESEIIVGFEEQIDRKQFESHIKDNTVLKVMHHENVKKGDAFYIPTGRIHAIGAGVLLAEIQQTSDVTYRVYDYDRVDEITGKTRDLHNDLAIDILDFEVKTQYDSAYKKEENVSNPLVYSSYFKSHFLKITDQVIKNYTQVDSFVIYICVSGILEIVHNNQSQIIKTGETILLPAAITEVQLKAKNAELLEVYL